MVMVETVEVAPAAGPVPTPGGPLSYIHWGPGIAGAIIAAATSFVLMSFASAVGLMVASPSPTWRDASVWLAILSGFWIIVVAVGSFALGGYVAGRVRSTWKASSGRGRIPRRRARADRLGARRHAGCGAARAHRRVRLRPGVWRRLRATPPARLPSLRMRLDRLFRPDTAGPELRAEAGRILMRGLGRDGIAGGGSRTARPPHVVRVRAWLPPDAERRVMQVLADARDAASQARQERRDPRLLPCGGLAWRARRQPGWRQVSAESTATTSSRRHCAGARRRSDQSKPGGGVKPPGMVTASIHACHEIEAVTIWRVTLSPPPRQIHDKSTTLFCPHDRRALTRPWNAT